ncbi:ribonuclease kappa [Echinococcus multilocularis]|uniref:Ribonuclease kappa n=1 Tax=Echinococcus multilocularis TaxID=6211 RepID=A0A068YEL7_ECHMU|nr:ribonuclease kappa [Echinococcus multilocularis]
MMAPLLGKKCSACLMILGVWGVIMLVLMGVFTRVNAVAFVDDIPIDMKEWESTKFAPSYIDEKFAMVSTNCFIAAGLYLLVLVFASLNESLFCFISCIITVQFYFVLLYCAGLYCWLSLMNTY